MTRGMNRLTELSCHNVRNVGNNFYNKLFLISFVVFLTILRQTSYYNITYTLVVTISWRTQ